jgi:4-hydroxy-tetrahydrodipicolinate synthase
MQTLKSNQIRGNWATLLLPINSDESIDFSRLSEELDILVSIKPDGIYSNGTAGEFYNITEDEFDRISELLAMKCESAGVPFQIGVSHMSPLISLERLKRSVHLKPSAVQVILPDWFKPTDEEAIVFLTKMAETAGDIGLVLYNPPHAKRNLSPAELLKLQQAVPSIVGIKVPSGDANWYEEMKPVAERISVFIPGHFQATAYQKGIGHGAYSNMACLNPKASQIWSDSMKTDLESALELESRILKFFAAHITSFITEQKYANQAVDKLLAAIGGWAPVGTRLRWPYRWVPESEAERLRPLAKDFLPEFFIQI